MVVVVVCDGESFAGLPCGAISPKAGARAKRKLTNRLSVSEICVRLQLHQTLQKKLNPSALQVSRKPLSEHSKVLEHRNSIYHTQT